MNTIIHRMPHSAFFRRGALILLYMGLLMIAQSQLIHITSVNHLPSNPVPATPVNIVVESGFNSGGCALTNRNVTWQSPNLVIIEQYHCLGMLTVMCNSTDTTNLGNLGPGNYTAEVRLYAGSGTPCTSFNLYDSRMHSFTVNPCNSGLNANFTFTAPGLTASFTNMSSGNAARTYLWNFGDGTTSTQLNPIHRFPTGGSYPVCLYATDSCGTDSFCMNVNINCPVPVASFTWSVNGMTAIFNNLSTPQSGYLWEFGDGTTSTIHSPSHTYAQSGPYYVCLYVTDSCGADTFCGAVDILTSGNAAGVFNSSGKIKVFPNPASRKISLLSTGDISSFRILDLSGKEILRAQHMKSVDVSMLPLGVYFWVGTVGESVEKGKLVIQRKAGEE